MTEHIPLNPQQLDAEKVVLLQTRKRAGSWVDTPVNIAVQGDCAYFRTPEKRRRTSGCVTSPRFRSGPAHGRASQPPALL
jgi:uncharacterized protein